MSSETQVLYLIGARVPLEFKREVRIEAARRDLTMDAAIRQALKLWLDTVLCPACDGPAFSKDNVWYCAVCNGAVAPDNGKDTQ